ncbi:hypothetical protein K440DRAFT_667791 [Wilcoxina mikolae CBS 423.85]|nr:hypothetical protein K440DRAFT_667791 [Wilcoxina mikolae CBS 423.85]
MVETTARQNNPTMQLDETVARGRPRRAKAGVNYNEAHESDSDIEEFGDSKPVKNPFSQANVRELANQMSRPHLERLVCAMFKSSAEFRASFKAEVNKVALAKRREVLPKTGENGLGTLGVLPAEVLVNILSYLKFKDRKTMTTAVSPDLNEYHWVASLWSKISTKDIPYGILTEKIIPHIQDHMPPKCVKELILVYKLASTQDLSLWLCSGYADSLTDKQYNLPRAERILAYFAREHELKSLTIEQGSATLKPKRMDFIKRLLEENESFRQVTDFTINMAHGGAYPTFNFQTLIELFQYWPHLTSVTMDVPGHYMDSSLQLKNFKELSMLRNGRIRDSYNYITRLSFSNSMKVDAEVMCHLGTLFPELEVGIFKRVSSARALTGKAKECWSPYEFVSRMPRLREIVIGLQGNNMKEESRAASMLFFSMIHHSPKLHTMVFEQHGYQMQNQMELFCAIKKWKNWRGICNDSIKSLNIKGWALEWDLLTHKGKMFSTPNIEKVDAIDCINKRNDDLIHFMKHGGNYPIPPPQESAPSGSSEPSPPPLTE